MQKNISKQHRSAAQRPIYTVASHKTFFDFYLQKL